ncbi:cobyric acid synthase [Shewanella sp. NIFS-20-20]|uniref:cobyric acid synthase n=1 Tax=Shewanella sp. NIFS-20-20 TaxID=2853806 RepID=UPI001C455FD3|nr:cobyric acid synthase [Shewanella sp. NIFS-20-20]MBV7314744.1 cobyric acid synthase [Shewanella sp. NIFS-20-20]
MNKLVSMNTSIVKPAASASCLMVQGTSSDAGKTTLVAGLCRIFARQGLQVAPFKPQNMALNSAVTIEGGEIGRAQALQAAACYQPPRNDFNPLLLKPQSDTQAQVVVQGQVLSSVAASEFFGPNSLKAKAQVFDAILSSYHGLKQEFDLVLVEGAGSPAEINLRAGDMANMGFAEAVDCPVILVADIDKGGVFAQIVGTLMLLSPSEQARVKGFVINRFRGDISLLEPGLKMLEERTGKPVIGVIPYLDNLQLDAEDGFANLPMPSSSETSIHVVVLVTPRISNHTDIDALRQHPRVKLTLVHASSELAPLPAADLIIIPGSKQVRDDLAYLYQQGWDVAIKRHLRYGGKVIGICGGYQMLGLEIDDSQGIEGEAGVSEGLGLLPMITELQAHKQLLNVTGTLQLNGQAAKLKGYEIHCGVSHLLRANSQIVSLDGDHTNAARQDGVLSDDNQILGTYVHGLFDHPEAANLLLQWAGLNHSQQAIDMEALREDNLNRLADTLAQHLDFSLLQLSLDTGNQSHYG